MPNQVFNNERPSSIKPESVFYGKMKSDDKKPSPDKFNTGMLMNQNIDYGNMWTQKIKDSNVTVKGSRKNGIMFR